MMEMKDSKIEWCDHTFSPWWGCAKVSPSCEHCYAETLAKRVGYGSTKRAIWGTMGPDVTRRYFGPSHWMEPLNWNERADDGSGEAVMIRIGTKAAGRQLDGREWNEVPIRDA